MSKPKSKNLILSSTTYERVVHWILVGSCGFLFLTGFGMMFHSLSFIARLFPGGYPLMKLLHNIDGPIFGLAFLLALIAWGRDTMTLEKDDKEWLRVLGGYLWEVESVPEMGKFNTGQKAFFWVLFAVTVDMIVTGFLMWFPIFPPVLTRWLYVLHVLGQLVLGGFLVLHFYLGTYGNPGTFQVMGSGYVTRAWAKLHRPKWLRDVEAGRRSI